MGRSCDHGVHADLAERLNRRQDVIVTHTVLDVHQHRYLDVVEVPTQRVAVTAKYVQLVGDSGRVTEDVARVGVLGHEAQCLLLPTATDEDSRARGTDGLWG